MYLCRYAGACTCTVCACYVHTLGKKRHLDNVFVALSVSLGTRRGVLAMLLVEEDSAGLRTLGWGLQPGFFCTSVYPQNLVTELRASSVS